MHHRRTRQNVKPLNFQSQNSSQAFINSPYLCTFGLMEEWRAREWLHCSLLHERAAQFSINLTSHALNLNDFDKRRAGSAELRVELSHSRQVAQSHLHLDTTTPYISCVCSARGCLRTGATMKLINEKSFVAVERSPKMDSSSRSAGVRRCV